MTLPEIPDSYSKLIDKIILIITLLVSLLNNWHINGVKTEVTTVQERQAVNAGKLDAVKTVAEDHGKKLDRVGSKLGMNP